MRAAAAAVALTATISLEIAAAGNSKDEDARIADWRAKRGAKQFCHFWEANLSIRL
jgi:hypothetical protein